eukprot:TRINITY_DN5523_c0_g1_i1.p1 TRINITY_DN5523_c0_g1~~TRINITY_DN5523_c0_g1_i1.p1  ORF type:complete len:880 (-),score=212.91 TRINITY_DN5523_c0_g1_i1:431-3070(-)
MKIFNNKKIFKYKTSSIFNFSFQKNKISKNLHSLRDNIFIPSICKKDKGFSKTIHFGAFSNNNIKIKMENFSTVNEGTSSNEQNSKDVHSSVKLVLSVLNILKEELNKIESKKEFASLTSDKQKEEIKSLITGKGSFGEVFKVLENEVNGYKDSKYEVKFGPLFTKILDPKKVEYTKEINRLDIIISTLEQIIGTIEKNPFTQPNSFKKFIEGLSNLPQSTKDKLNNLGNTQYSTEETNKAESSIENNFSSDMQKIQNDLDNLNQSKLEEESKIRNEKDQGKRFEIEQRKENLDKQIKEKKIDLKKIKEKMISDQIKKDRMEAFGKELKAYHSFCSMKKSILENLLKLANQLIMNVNPTTKSSDRDTSKSTDTSSKGLDWGKYRAIIAILGAIGGFYIFLNSKSIQSSVLIRRMRKGEAIPEILKSDYLDKQITSNDEIQDKIISNPSDDKSGIYVLYGSSEDGKTEFLKRVLKKRGKNVIYISTRASKGTTNIPGNFLTNFTKQLNHYGPHLKIPFTTTSIELFPIPSGINSWDVLEYSLMNLADSCDKKWSKDNPIPIVVIDDLHSWVFQTHRNKWEFDNDVGQKMMGRIEEMRRSNTAIFIFGVSEMERLPAFDNVTGLTRKDIRYQKITDQVFEESLKGSSILKNLFGKNIDVASKEITQLIGSNFGSFNQLMNELSKVDLSKKNGTEVKIEINKIVNEMSNNKNFNQLMEDGLIDNTREIYDDKYNKSSIFHSVEQINKSGSALMADLIIRCVSNNNNTKHLPFQRRIFGEFGKRYSNNILENFYDTSIDYFSDNNLIHSIDSNKEECDLHKRIISQTWKQWSQKIINQDRLDTTRKSILWQKNNKPIFPSPDEIDEICSKFYKEENIRNSTNK